MPLPTFVASYDEFLDVIGLCCPEPLMLIRRALSSMPSESILYVVGDDPTLWRDLPLFCHFVGHSLLACNKKDSILYFWVQKMNIKP